MLPHVDGLGNFVDAFFGLLQSGLQIGNASSVLGDHGLVHVCALRHSELIGRCWPHRATRLAARIACSSSQNLVCVEDERQRDRHRGRPLALFRIAQRGARSWWTMGTLSGRVVGDDPRSWRSRRSVHSDSGRKKGVGPRFAISCTGSKAETMSG